MQRTNVNFDPPPFRRPLSQTAWDQCVLFRGFFLSPPPGPTAKSLPCSNGKKSCRTSFQLSLKQKSAYGDGLVWVLRFQRNAFYNISNWPPHQRRHVTHKSEQQRTIKDSWRVRSQPDLGTVTRPHHYHLKGPSTAQFHKGALEDAAQRALPSKKIPNILG